MPLIEMNEAAYNAAPGIRRSTLFEMSRSPAHYKWAKENPSKDTPALQFGRALHCAVLEPDKFETEYLVAPTASKATKAGREIWAAFAQDAEGKEVLSQADYEKCIGIRDSIMNHPMARVLLEGPHEKSFFWKDELTGLDCKVRADALLPLEDRIIVVDVKTCSDASTEAFMREAIKYGYDFQSGMYTEGVSVCSGMETQFVFIAVEKTPPYSVNVLAADKYFILRGKDLFREYLGKVAECESTGNWYQYNGADGDMNDLKLLGYLQKEYE